MTPKTAPAMPEPQLGTLDPLRHTTLSTAWDWSVQEAGWSVDVFARMFATILMLRTVSQLVTTWWFPRTVWDASPTLVRGFGGTPPTSGESPNGNGADHEEADDEEEPELVLTSEGERFYRHHTRHPSQYWPCPLLLQDRCRDCRWFTEDFRWSASLCCHREGPSAPSRPVPPFRSRGAARSAGTRPARRIRIGRRSGSQFPHDNGPGRFGVLGLRISGGP